MAETSGSKLATELAAFVRARKALFFVQTQEEGRAGRGSIEALAGSGYRAIFWDAVRGAVEYDGSPAALYKGAKGQVIEGRTIQLDAKSTRQPPQILALIDKEREKAIDVARKAQTEARLIDPVKDGLERIVWFLRDFDPYLKDAMVRRHVRNLAESLMAAPREGAHAIVIVTTSNEVPPDLADAAVVLKWTLPDREELSAILDASIGGLPKDKQAAACQNGTREAAIEAAVGLSANAAATIFKKSLVTKDLKIDPALVAAEKKRVVNAAKGVEWYDPDPRGLEGIGGLEILKEEVDLQKDAFSAEAAAFGIEPPRGIILVGVPGCGKSATAKAIGTAWKIPLLRLDIAACKGGIVGQSEAQIRAAFALAETIGRCVLWIDEGEKAFAGAVSGANDGGTSSDALGAFLTWMEERKAPVYVVMTANDVSGLPPELLRAGRFDGVWFVDLPTQVEREAILRVSLKKVSRELSEADIRRVAEACGEFAGVEVAKLVQGALLLAFYDGKRDIRAEDLLSVARGVIPLSRTAKPKIDKMREWAKGNARPASRIEARESSPAVPYTGGELDVNEGDKGKN